MTAQLKTARRITITLVTSGMGLALPCNRRRGSSCIKYQVSVFRTGLHLSSWPYALVVFFPLQRAPGAVFGHPTAGSLFVQKIEPQTPDVHSSPFSLIQGPDEVSVTDLALPVEECAVIDRDLLFGPQMSGR